MLQPPLPSTANPAGLGREWGSSILKREGNRIKTRLWGFGALPEPFYPSRGWLKTTKCGPADSQGNTSVFHDTPTQFPTPSGAFEGSSKQKAKCSWDPLYIWGKSNILASTAGNIQSCWSNIIWYKGYLSNLLLWWKLRFQEDPVQDLLADFPFLGIRQKMEKFSFQLPGKSMCYNLCILMVQQLGRCRITATSFWIQTTTNCPRLRPLTNKSTFLPNPSLGSWNHTGLQDHHLPHSSPAVSHGFLFPALFHHPAANPKMIFNWLKSTKPPKRVGISLGVPRAPETLCLSLASWFLGSQR